MRDGVAHATDWMAIIFNPSLPYRLVHMLLASGLTAAFLVAGLSAFRMLLGDRSGGAKAALKTGVTMAAILIPLQILAGDQHGLNTLEYQPAKVAAMEANWETGPARPLILFAVPDEETRENAYEVAIPYGASLILKHDPEGVVPGLDEFVTAEGTVEHPPVAPVFYAFRIMVGIGMAMLVVSFTAAWFVWRRRAGFEDTKGRWMLRGLVAMTFSGWVATLAGWYTTEIGRQPWLVNGVMTTAEAVGPVTAPMVMSTLVMYLAAYAVLTTAYIGVLFYLARKTALGEPLPGPMTPRSDEAEVAILPAE